MKPAPFDYYAPDSLDEALMLLAEHGDAAKPIAGGQSLVPTMNFRLAQPSVLVDLNRISSLFGIHADQGGGLRVGAMTRQRAVERSPLVAERAPLVAETMPFIAHPQIRNRGTFGGSIAHADPAAELPALAVVLDMGLTAQSQRGQRQLAAGDFFLGLFETALEPDELLVEVQIPALPARTGVAFEEIARRHGDYALVGAAAVVTLDGSGRVASSRLAFLSIGDGPVVVRGAGRALQGEAPTDEAIRAAAAAIHEEIEPQGDVHATAAYRRYLAEVLARRTLARAAARAGGGNHG